MFVRCVYKISSTKYPCMYLTPSPYYSAVGVPPAWAVEKLKAAGIICVRL